MEYEVIPEFTPNERPPPEYLPILRSNKGSTEWLAGKELELRVGEVHLVRPSSAKIGG